MDPLTILAVIATFFVLIMFFGFAASIYQKCGPNQAMIISGFGARSGEHSFKIVKGGGSLVMPLLQQRSFLSLEIMTIDVGSKTPVITRTGIPAIIEGVAQVKVSGDRDSIATAAEQFLGKTEDEIASVAHETLMGHLRAILGTLEVEDLISKQDSFAHRVQEVSIPDLAKMGLSVVSFTIKEIRDTTGYLQQLGRKRDAEIKKEAEINVSNSDRDQQIAKAENLRQAQIVQAETQKDTQIYQVRAAQEAANAKIESETLIAEKNKDFQVKQAEYRLEVEQKRAASDLAYEIVKAQSTQKLVEEQQKVKIVEAQKEVELQSVGVQKRQVQLEAEITKPAEAEQQKVRILTLAEQERRQMLAKADAESNKISAIGEAEAIRVKAIAEAEAIRARGLAEAEKAKAQGLAEAAIIAAKGDAEAEAMSKRAEAFKQYNDAAMASMIIERLPAIVESAASPLAKIGNMTVLSTGGDGTGASKISNEVMNVAAQGLTMVKGLTGIDLSQKLLNSGEKANSDSKDNEGKN